MTSIVKDVNIHNSLTSEDGCEHESRFNLNTLFVSFCPNVFLPIFVWTGSSFCVSSNAFVLASASRLRSWVISAHCDRDSGESARVVQLNHKDFAQALLISFLGEVTFPCISGMGQCKIVGRVLRDYLVTFLFRG